jgi:hypothetical protein
VHPARTPLVELLYFDGCPHYEDLLRRVVVLLGAAGAAGSVVLRMVPDEATAQQERFLGSPTVRVDGRDVEPGVGERVDFGLRCRLYTTAHGPVPVPPDEWIVGALRRPPSR